MANLTPEQLDELRTVELTQPVRGPYDTNNDFLNTVVTPLGDALNPFKPTVDSAPQAAMADALGMSPAIGAYEYPKEITISPDEVPPQPFDTVQPSGVLPPKADAVEGPSPETKLAAAEVVLGQSVGQPSMINQVVGKESKTTTSQVQSPESKAAASALEQAQADSKSASELELKAAKDQADIDAKISKEDADVITSIETARATSQAQKQAEFAQTIADIDGKVAELANFKPETFWGSKSTADKIAASMSVGLGSFAQSLLGSGQNVGMVLLERNMSEFDRNQQLVYQNKLKQIEAMKGSLEMKKALADDAEKTFDAQKLAARAQVQSQNAKALAMAKTPSVQAAIQQRQAKFGADIATKQAEIASKYEAKSTETAERDIIKQVMQAPGMGRDGKPLKLTEGEAKARVALADVVAANQALKNVDVDKVGMSPAYLKYFNDTASRNAITSLPWGIGRGVGAVGDAIAGTPEEALARRDPEAAKVNAAIDSWTRGVIRYKSGAAIAVQEQTAERNQYWPAPGDTPKSLADKARARAEIEKAMRQAGAL